MTSHLLRDASKRVASLTEQRELLFELWADSAPGTQDGERLWQAYQAAKEDEVSALRAFHSLWLECERSKDMSLADKLESTLKYVQQQKREARR